MGDLFAGLYARGEAAALVSGDAWLAAMLEVEAALARACAAAQLIPPQAAQRIAEACAPARFDLRTLAREAAQHATPVVPLVAALRAEVGPELARYVHLGATSQDILDTAMMLLAHRVLGAVLSDVRACARAAAALADRHRATAMSGRTLLQQALPTSFGLRAAGWLAALCEASADLTRVRERVLAAQMGGPVGTREPRIAELVATELGLAQPRLPWHANRVRVASLGGALGSLCGVLAKISRDVTLLAQNEVGAPRAGACGDLARMHGAGARAGRGLLAGRVGDVVGAACPERLGVGVGP